MSNITVLSRTQRVIVDPATSSVSVILAGPAGPPGTPGSGVAVKGSDVYADIIAIADPEVGDLWIQTDTAGGGVPGDGLVWNGTTWTNVGPIRGPQGIQGIQGIQGNQGPQGIQGIPGTNGVDGEDGTAATDAHIADTTDAHDASAISFTPAGSIAATNVQAAIEEVAAEGGGGGSADLEGLTDVDLTSPAEDDILIRGATQWVNEPGTNHFEPAGAVATHIADSSAAHAASAISYAGGTGISATDVEAAIDELATEKANDSALTAHITDSSAAHAASAISYAGGTGMSATDVEAAIDELATEKTDDTTVNAHIADATAAHAASAIAFTPAGTIAATTVQAAIEEVASEAGGAGATDLEGLTDVDLTTPAENDILIRGATQWVNEPGTDHFEAAGAVATHIADATAAHAASAISYAGGTGMSATDVEAALDELATEKSDTTHNHSGVYQPLDTDLTTLSSAFTSATASGPASLALAEDTDNGANTVSIIAPATVASNKTATLQDVTGTIYVTGGTDVAVADGGTGASDAPTALTNLGAASSAALTAHIDDTVDAHDASAISYAGGTGISATTVEGAIDELATEKTDDTVVNAHIADATAAHAASAISYAGGTGISATDVEAAIDELATEKTDASLITANGMGVVHHGSTAGTARPSGFAAITWIGTVAPTNANTSLDVWIDTT